jgi:hypothetical protein
MSSDYEISAWSEIERVNRFLDGISLSPNEILHSEGQDKKSVVPNDESLALQYYDFLNAATIKAGHIEICNYNDIEHGAFLGAGATMIVNRGLWRSKAVAIK